MGKANLVKQVCVSTKNEVGMLQKVTSAVGEANVNITGICAWSEGEKAEFRLLTSDNAKAISALKGKGLQAAEEEIVTLMLEDKVGAAADIAQKVKTAGIDLIYVYGTTCGCKDTTALLVLNSKENSKLVSCLDT